MGLMWFKKTSGPFHFFYFKSTTFFCYFIFLLIVLQPLGHELAGFTELKQAMYTKFAQLNQCGKHSYKNKSQRISGRFRHEL